MKKNWKMPSIQALSVKSTEHGWIGFYRDGGYIGDGEVSGHLSWNKPSNEEPNSEEKLS